jgi:hypothetical protein
MKRRARMNDVCRLSHNPSPHEVSARTVPDIAQETVVKIG